MTLDRGSPSSTVSALISDVDGTLVTDDKRITERSRAAVAALREAGIAFTLISSRPPRGLRGLIEILGITGAVAGFNGGVLATPGLSTIEQHPLAREIARDAVDLIMAQGIDVWVFSDQDWLLRDPKGPYVARETRTVRFAPTVIADFAPFLGTVFKIVAVSEDFDRLARCDGELRSLFSGAATVARSQRYYLDVTHPLANKGTALLSLLRYLAIPPSETAVIGDGANDVAMFERAGLSIAMGNAAPEVQKQARYVTSATNNGEGFAEAVERFILRR